MPTGRAVDPNDKVGPSGFGAEAFVAAQQILPYTINFENISTATAAAQRIRVTDQLDPNLDGRTFRLKEIGFGNYRVTVPDNRSFYQTRVPLGPDLGNLVADISAGIDIQTGQARWTLTAIDPNTGEQPQGAQLGLLPPNNASGSGQGFMTFTVQPKSGLATGTRITNQAQILFDAEPPILTNLVTNTLDADAPASRVAPLPARVADTTFPVSWSGEDDAGGAGLHGFDIWVSEDNGPYTLWLSDVTQTSAAYTGRRGRSYRFYSVARDHAGNAEAAPAEPDALVRVAARGGKDPATPSSVR